MYRCICTPLYSQCTGMVRCDRSVPALCTIYQWIDYSGSSSLFQYRSACHSPRYLSGQQTAQSHEPAATEKCRVCHHADLRFYSRPAVKCIYT